jgi:NADH:ubiquinone reductase (H+-translocating)
MMAITGRNAAIVQTGRLRLTGRLAWITWGFLHLTYLPGALNRMTTGLKYLWWHLSHENTNRVLIESEPATPPPAHPAGTAGSALTPQGRTVRPVPTAGRDMGAST